MAELTEGMHAGEFIVSEANGSRSREVVTIDTGDLVAGQVLGVITKGAAAGAAGAGNTGAGTITAAPAIAAGAKAGEYLATCIAVSAGAGTFLVTDPDGVPVGVATVGVEFSGGGLTFTIADGDPDFALGDVFTITVSGSGKYVAYNQDGADGTESAAGVLYANTDATDADQSAVAIVRDAEVNGNDLTWPADIESAEETAAIAQLAAIGIIVR